jgi:hypothetical protein
MNLNSDSEFGFKEKITFYIFLDIGVRHGSEMKFKSRDFDFNEFPISERIKPFINRKFGIWSKGSKFKPMALNPGHFKIQGKDLNFKKGLVQWI